MAGNKKKISSKSKIILSVIAAIVMIPSILCIALIIRLGKLEKYIDSNVVKEGKETTSEVNVLEADANKISTTHLSESSKEEPEETAVKSDDYMPYDGIVKVCITFDDGPSIYTDDILDILDDYGIKATFFINGHEGFDDQLVRIVEEGHTIGMHSYTHSYRNVYRSLDSFADDLYEIQSFIKDKTGVDCVYYRFPGGSSNHVSNVAMSECIEYLHAKGIEYYDWNVSASDAVVGGASVNAIVNNVMREVYACESDTIIILFHDSGDKRSTVEALPIIIEKIADMNNVAFVPINEDIEPIHHVEE